ncbi:MAG: CRISPR-associated endonuclease Cas3'', partial [Gammaproteobacteria bacterium]|nr:CRISPR-associated endonuclease Cas3'' [Gammaproteobacteria bacterium]
MIDISSLAGDWPGKKSDSTEHPAIWHMLDVASCAEQMIRGHRAFVEYTENQCRAFVVLAALHDIGKISVSFRDLVRDGRQGQYRHWKLSDLLLINVLDPIIEEEFGGNRHARCELYAAVSGHHGGPERTNDRREIQRRRRCIGADAEQAAKDWLTLLLGLYPGGTLEGLDQPAARKISWALSGLTVASDWVASNADWFPPATTGIGLHDYHARSRAQARDAIARAGLDQAATPTIRDARTLTGLPDLHPMQQAVEKVSIPDGPVLALIEDATGSGKTESALIMAHRLISSGRARGLFFALPTMATADAMFGRMVNAVSRLFEGSAPSVSLSHGRAGLNTRFRELTGADDDASPEAGCTRWLADDRRRSMLAEVGVGTIDQALMGVLPTRFSTLRLFGLTDRV